MTKLKDKAVEDKEKAEETPEVQVEDKVEEKAEDTTPEIVVTEGPDLKVYQGKPVAETKVGLFSGKIAADLQEEQEDLAINWDGGKITSELWEVIKAFMKWTYDEHTTEGQLRLYYDEKNGVWDAHPMPQYICAGLFTEEVKDSDEAEEINKKFNPMQWQYMGTVHHHCGAGAFQSGVDHKDEETKTGLHITLGHVNSKEWDIHARCSFRGLMYTVDLKQWIPEDEDEIKAPEGDFPEEWKSCLVEKPKPKWRYGAHGVSRGVSGSSVHGVTGGYRGSGYGKSHQMGFGSWESDCDWFDSENTMSAKEQAMRAHSMGDDEASVIELDDDEEFTAQYVRQELDRLMYCAGTELKDYIMDHLEENPAHMAEDTLDDLSMLYDTIETLLNNHGFDPTFLLNVAVHTLCDLLPDYYTFAINPDGTLEFDIGDPPKREQCLACEGTGFRSKNPMRGICGVCHGSKYVMAKKATKKKQKKLKKRRQVELPGKANKKS
jgi:hypothetical protein